MDRDKETAVLKAWENFDILMTLQMKQAIHNIAFRIGVEPEEVVRFLRSKYEKKVAARLELN